MRGVYDSVVRVWTVKLPFEVAGYAKNDKKGTAKVTLKGIENGETLYGGLKTVNFKIVQKKGSWKSGGKTLIDGEWK